MTNLTSDILETSVGPIPVSGEEEVTSSTLKPTDPPASEDPSKDGEAQPDPKPEIEDAKHTVVDEQGTTSSIHLLSSHISGIHSNRNSEALHFDTKSLR